jgi:putative transposase
MRRSFRYRLYPNRAQNAALNGQVDEACRLYNAALEERRAAWKSRRIVLCYYDQNRQLKGIRATGDCGIANYNACQEVLRGVDRTFRAFFRRVKSGQHAGSPRYKPRQRYNSLTFVWDNGCRRTVTNRLYVQGVGEIRARWHRPLPAAGVIKTLTVTRQAGHWFGSFCVELPAPEPLPPVGAAIGLDLGITAFATCSDGSKIANPRCFRAAERAMRVAQRRLARRKRRSRRRQKARQVVARLHAHIANQRRDFHHKTARRLVTAHGLIAIEDLNVCGLARSPLGKHVHDAGWSQFIRILSDKASSAGRQLIVVNPAGTTQNCSRCGTCVPKCLSERWHECDQCGLSLDRDENAARNVLQRALVQTARMGPSGLNGGGSTCAVA